jgi:MFS family permease
MSVGDKRGALPQRAFQPGGQWRRHLAWLASGAGLVASYLSILEVLGRANETYESTGGVSGWQIGAFWAAAILGIVFLILTPKYAWRAWRAFRRSHGHLTRADRQALVQFKEAESHWSYAVDLCRDLPTKPPPHVERLWSVPLDEGEQVIADVCW